MARAFQTWRQNTSTRRISRSERDQALHNWAVATSFWAVHLLRRCFNKWRTLAPRKALMAMSIWGDNSRAGCFRRWLVFTRFLRSKGAQGVRLWRGRLIQRCWRRWRVFTWARQRKARAIKRARKLWVERTLRSCWLQWQDFTSDRQRRVLASEKAIAFWSDRRLQSCWLEWRSFTTTRRRLTLAMRRALAFWSDRQLLSSLLEWRQFTLDRRRKTLHMSRAIKFWTGSALQACWRQWRGFAAASRCKALATQRALGFWSARVRLSCVRSWRRYTIDRLRKAEATDKALRLWARSSLAACWSTWLSFTAKQQHKAVGLAKAVGFYRDRTFRNCLFEWSLQVESARQNMHLAETMRVRRLLHKWQLVASSLAKLLTAHDTIQQADRRRLLLASMQTLADAYAARDEASKRLRLALVRLQTRRLRGAFNKLRAVSIRGQRKRERSDMALEWWSSRCLARAWTAWRKAQESSIYATEAARDHALKILRPLLRNAFYGWLGWHEGKMMRRSREVDACRTLTSRKQHLVLGAWRGSVLDNIQLIAACQSIMRNEVHRLMVAAVRQLRREHDHARRAAEGRRVVQGGAARRCLRHWKALGQARQAQDELRIQRLRVAAAQRIRRILMAWQLVACLHAEHERLVHVCIIGMNRRWAAAIIRAWRGTVLDSVTMRMKMLAALLAWERGLKVRAWRAWNALLAASRASACRFAMAARHYRTRRLGLCFGALSTAWRAYRERLVRALRFRTLHTRGLVAEVLAAWKELVEVLKWKNMRTRRAVTHARHRLLAGSMYGWYYITRHRVESKHTVAVAVLHWVRRRRAATLSWWRAWATTHRALRLRGEGYWMVRAGRIKAGVFLRLRANVVRNLRIAAAVTHRNRYMARLALSGWLLRTLLAAEWVSRLQSVGTQLFWKVLEDSLATWQAYVVHRRRIHVMMRTAMHYWRLGRQRSALDSLRWHATRRQIMRAAVVRGCQRVASRVLRAWCTEAHYRRGLRDRFALLQFHTQRGTLKRSLDRWRIFLVVLAFRRDQNIVAVQHYLRVMMWTAFRRWYLYHMHLRHATERAQAILRRWRRRDAAVVLAAFAENVVFRRQMRDAESVFRITCSRRVFAAWQEFLGMKRATAFWRHKRLTGIVAAWRQYVRWRRGLRAIGAHVALRWRSLTAALVLATWRDLTRERQRLMELGFILATQTTRSALSALLLAWSEYATRSTWLKCIAAAIAARLRAKTLSTILTTWHVTAVRRAGLKRIAAAVTARSRHAALVIAFGFWYWHALNASRLRQISEQLSARTQRGLMATAMVAWCSHVGRAVRLRASHEVIATRVRLGALRATFFTWRGRTAYKVHLKSIEHQIIAKRCAYTSARVIGLWHSYASYKAHLRVAERKISRGLYVREAGIVLGEWRARAAYKARLHRAEKSVTLRIRMSALEDLFSSWRNWTQYKARLATTGAQVAWRQRRSWVIEVYSAWRSYAAYRAKLRGALEKVRTRRHRRMLAQACTTWRLYMLRMSALRGLLERVLMRATGLAFYGWREMVADAKRWRAIQEATRARLEQKPALADTACYAAARLRLWPLSLAFYTWYDNSKECRYLRGKASDAIFTYAGTLLRKALAMWLAYALRRRHMRQKLNRFRAVAKTKAQKATFRRWQSLAQYHRTLRLASRVLKEKVDGQTLRSAMQLWRATAARWGGLKGILARSMARLLSMAWDGWIEETIAGRERAQAVQVIGTRWAHRILADYLAAWRRLVSAVKAVRRLLARMQRRRKLWSWAAWQEAVFQGALVRGGELHRQLRAQRVLRGWRGVAEDVRRAGKLKAQMQQRKAHKVLMDWRRLWLARVCCRRVYYRRVLVGWYERTQELRQARARLWHATHVILYGSMARCFTVWRQHTQAMAIKRAVFVRKQRALADALRRGDELAARRNAELTELAFRAWRWLAIIYKEVQRRQAVATARMAAVVWAGWRKYTRVRRAREAKKDTVLRRRLLSRPLAAWRKASAAAKAKLGAAVMHRRTVLLESAMCAWFSYHDHVAARRAALRRALAAGNAAAAAALRFRAWEAWCEIMMRRIAVGELVEQAIRRRCRRSLQLAFDLWLKYTQAMHSGGIDPGSPYLTPRRRDADRRLVIRMAAMAGNEQALVGSDSVPSGGVLDGLYPSSGLKHAMERQQEVAAFLSLARHTSPSAGGAGGGSRGGSGATAGAAFASAMLAERQRLRHLDRDRRPSHDSGNGPSGSGSGTASMAGSSHASSITSTLSSGANGADLADLALQVVQVAPGLSPQGKGKSRGPSSAGQPQYVTGTAVQRPLNTFRDSDTGVGGSPYDDRLDLRALYDVAGTRASNVPPPPAAHGYAGPQALFGGFTPGHLPVDKLTPLSRGTATFPNPSATVVQITPRRIEFTAGRSGTGAYDIAPSYYGYVTASRSQQVRRESDSDVSTTSSDLLPPAEVRTRAAATAAADDAITAAATAVAAVSSWRSGTASREPHSSPKGRSWPRGLAPQATGGKGRFGGGMVATMQPSSTGLQRPAAAAAVASGGGKGAGMLQLGACGHMSGWRTSGTSQGSAGGISGLHASGGGAGGMPSAAAAVAPAVPYRGSILDRRAVQQGR
ncbi:hypothetical protein VaNZ11_010162 [Volvox africanus]|uniref:Sfi1 spindle body domain-containing protein n=1 Tax=Volvox africanus TaxID=51714 RepID=A0ABQ5S9V0_9CHLO|nr:hypothetical protein VaNZ11_010162 [Volvox africanus]